VSSCEQLLAVVSSCELVLCKLMQYVPHFSQVWFFVASTPEIATSAGSRMFNNVWWKSSHALMLKEDPGLELTKHALKFITERRFKDDPDANTTADLTKAASSHKSIVVKNSLETLLRDENLEEPSEGEDDDDAYGGYGPQLVHPGEMVRLLATHNSVSNKRKQSEPTQNQQCPQEEHGPCSMQELEAIPTFQQMGATGIQCAWCEKWRFVCPVFHIVPEISDEDGCTTFECHELKWCDGTLLGLSCESFEQDFRPPNPKDNFAKHKAGAETEMKNFFEWWSETSDTPGEDDSDISIYREHYWEYLAHTGTLVPEGFADHPIHTMTVDDLGK
jgi:hypothetical protein